MTILLASVITGFFTAAGTLGGIWLKGRQDSSHEQRQARQAAEAAEAQRQQAAYADLVVTAREALRNMRQLSLAYAADTPDEPEVREAFRQSGRLASELGKATAIAEIVGTPGARTAARIVYDSAKNVADFYQARSLRLAAAEQHIGVPRGMGLVPFNADKAQTLCDTLSQAIDDFVTAVRPEAAGTEPAKQGDTPESHT